MDNSELSILLISDDTFILGLLKGYGHANHLSIHTTSALEKIDPEGNENNFKLIIFDIRELDYTFAKRQLKALHTINNNNKASICAVFNNVDGMHIQEESWIDFYLEDPIMEQLDNYLREHFSYNFHPFPNRRNHDRRSSGRRSEDNQKILTTHYSGNHSNNNYKVGPFSVNNSSQSVYFKEKNLKLTRKEFKLFSFLAADTEHIFTAEEIISHLWPENDRANKSDLYQYMHLLRRKVEDDPDNPHWVITLKGVGYKLSTEPLYDIS